MNRLIQSLQERANELECLYQIEEALQNPEAPLDEVCPRLIQIIPSGWQYPDLCMVRIRIEGSTFCSPGFAETAWTISAQVDIEGTMAGSVDVFYSRETSGGDDGPFLMEETQLLRAIGRRLGCFVAYRTVLRKVRKLGGAAADTTEQRNHKWQRILHVFKLTDPELYLSIARKMMYQLCASGITEAEEFLQPPRSTSFVASAELREDWNVPHRRRKTRLVKNLGTVAFEIAVRHFSDERIQFLVEKWYREDKLSHLERLISGNWPMTELGNTIRNYYPASSGDHVTQSAGEKGVLVSLIRRVLSDQLQYINTAKRFMHVADMGQLLERVVCCKDSIGKLGGKSAGIYLAAQILRARAKDSELLDRVKVPRTWHVTSDAMRHFVRLNGFDDVIDQKYKEPDQIYYEYPYIVQTFKSARFPPEMINGLTVALDYFGDRPLIVRSSSLLEDRAGAVFSGKYRSLFLANQGDRHERLDALTDAISEVYASTFCPDAIEYRSERGLLDFVEEMGIIIQEVVGTRVGDYFLPTFAGVAFGSNEFRWSPRIKREDGLLRLVPGLGTRAVDRMDDDYPVLVAPGQPGLRVNVCTDEIIRYSPKKIDVINLATNDLETLNIDDFLSQVGTALPGVENMLSVLTDDQILRPVRLGDNPGGKGMVVTFERLITNTQFVKQMQTILTTLEQEIGLPVDVEFASDGKNLYLLQCRPQSSFAQSAPTPIPRDIPSDRIVFTANRYVSNGSVPDITHVVYVVSSEYEKLSSRSELISVGRAVGKLNRLLPKRKFILMGPGRWGSRGDIKLGVRVTYSDINNTAVLIEIAHQKGDYLPDLSFGTHFFQDLVEANIRYLPLYPDKRGVVFNRRFLESSQNSLVDILPEFAALSDVIRVIDVPRNTDGKVLRVLLNADHHKAMGLLVTPTCVSSIIIA